MKIIKAVHINGTDKRKRYWKVPDHLQPIRLRKGDEAAVETANGPQRVEIVDIVTSRDGFLYWKNGEEWNHLEVTQEVLAFFDRKTKEVKYPPKAQ